MMFRLSFGSCRRSAPMDPEHLKEVGADALVALANRMMASAHERWPDALYLAGDQVYADIPSPQQRQRLLSQHGAVSAECAVAMATGVAEQLGADYGVAITGFAGPTGGAGENPIGTIYIGLHAPGGDWSKKLTWPGPRCAVKERAVTAAIDWLRREVFKEARRTVTPLAN